MCCVLSNFRHCAILVNTEKNKKVWKKIQTFFYTIFKLHFSWFHLCVVYVLKPMSTYIEAPFSNYNGFKSTRVFSDGTYNRGPVSVHTSHWTQVKSHLPLWKRVGPCGRWWWMTVHQHMREGNSLKTRGVTSLGKMLGIRKIRGLNLHLRFGRVSLMLVVSNPSITQSWKKWKSPLQKSDFGANI